MSTDTHEAVSPLDREQIAHLEVGHTNVRPGLARLLVMWFLVSIAALPIVEWLGAPDARDASPAGAFRHLVGVPRAVGERLDALAASAPNATAWTRLVAANREVLAGLNAFETVLEDESPVGRWLRPPAQAALSGWLGAGNERVYVGREGWLFYRPDVEHVTGRGFLEPAQLERRIASAREIDVPPQPDPRAAIAQFKRDLDARGIVLIVMPIPVKPTVHPCALARPCEAARSGPPASSVPSAALHDAASSAPSAALQPAATSAAQFENASQSELIADLRRDGVLVFDPVPVLLRSDSGEPQYLRTDTHWRPEAMQRVAEALAAFIQAQVALPFVTEPGYRAEPREARQIGDTAAMLDLPAGQALYPPERVALRFVLGPDGDPWRPSRDADVLVLGDSFTNMYSLATMGWGEAAGLVEQLSHVLRRPVDRIVQNDQGASATRELLRRELGDEGDRLAGKRVVVWQFAARELSFGDWRVIELPPSQ